MARTRRPAFDKYRYYAASLPPPATVVPLLDRVYREARGKGAKPRALREDFCGTFANSCEWVRLDEERRAFAVDRDVEALAYGRDHFLAGLDPAERKRVRILEKSATSPDLPSADVIACLNQAYRSLKTRPQLLDYFRNCRRTLEPGGVLVLDCQGGPDLQQTNEVEKAFDEDGYTCFLEQEDFDPLSNGAIFHVHFQRHGERKRRKVFTYAWRVYNLAELRDALLDSGFAAVRTYWEGTTSAGEGDGNFVLTERVEEGADRWMAYVAALR